MSENQIQVRRKTVKKSSFRKIYLIVCAGVLILLGTFAVLALTVFRDKLTGGFSAPPEISFDGKRQIIRVPAGGNLQTAINKANGGDIIELQAGAVYNGEIRLPNKPLTDFITIQTSVVKQLPEDQRVNPSQSKLMAKITGTGQGKPALSTEKGANHFRFVGIEFAPDTKDYTYNLIYLAADTSDKTADTPHHLEFDRCFIHSTAQGVTRRGMALNSAQTVVKNSYFQGFAYAGEETQGICGWTGSKEVKILNNYIEGGAENIMFGGSDIASVELIPSDIEIRGNHLSKPQEWKGKVTTKTLFELKNAKKVQFTDNYLENNWVGSAFRITVRNETGGSPYDTVEDVTIKNNLINGAGEGFNILGTDNNYPSQILKRLNITNNLLLNIGTGEFSDGSGYFMQISSGEDVLIANNTSFNNGNIATLYGDLPKNLVVRDNIAGHGNYGVHGLENINSPAARQFFSNNIFVNNRGIPDGDKFFPPNNFWITDYKSVGFVNLEQYNLLLAAGSRFKSKGTNKTEIGCDTSRLNLNLIGKN